MASWTVAEPKAASASAVSVVGALDVAVDDVIHTWELLLNSGLASVFECGIQPREDASCVAFEYLQASSSVRLAVAFT